MKKIISIIGTSVLLVAAACMVWLWSRPLPTGLWSDDRTVGNVPARTGTPPIVRLADGAMYILTAAPVMATLGGATYHGLAYNGSIPGPLIVVPQGATITLVHDNAMTFETSLHSHGVRVANAMDGVVRAHGGAQDPSRPNTQFLYTLTFPDAGVYWYHPHLDEAAAQDRGLYGNFWVLPRDTAALPPVGREEFVTLDDVVTGRGAVPMFAAPGEGRDQLMGRYGDAYVVNGRSAPYDLGGIAAGSVVRFYLTNTANARPFDIAWTGGARMKVVGGDNGWYERDRMVDSVVIAPSERYIVDVLFPTPGTYHMINRKGGRAADELLSVTIGAAASSPTDAAAAFDRLLTRAGLTREFDDVMRDVASLPHKRLLLSMDMAGMGGEMGGMHGGRMGGMAGMPCHVMGGSVMGDCTPQQRATLLAQAGIVDDGIEWDDMGMGGMMDAGVRWYLQDEDTGKRNMDIAWSFARGDRVHITLRNPSDGMGMHPMQHPFHLHGQRMVVTAVNGVPTTDRVWKDTVLVPAGTTVDLVAVMDNPGTWMAHCHIAEHLENGMMMTFTVQE